MPGIKRHRTNRLRALQIAISLTTVILVVAAMEVGLRLIGRPGWDLDVVAGWKYNQADSHVNELGYRGQPLVFDKTNLVVLLVGDSCVESASLPFEGMPEQLLERRLKAVDPRYKVFSLGAGGYGNDQQLIALQDYFSRYRADVVILWQVFGNDIWNNVFPTHWPKDGYMKPTFWLEDGTLKGPNHSLGAVVQRRARTKLGVLVNRILDPRKGLDASWEKRLPPPYVPITNYQGPFRLDWDLSGPNGKINPLLNDENFATEKSHEAVYFKPRSPRMEYALRLTREIINRIAGICGEQRSRFAITYFTVPKVDAELCREDPVMQRIGDQYYRSSCAQYKSNRKLVNEGFVEIEAPITVPDWRVSETDGHLNVAATDEIMKRVADWIIGSDSTHLEGRQGGWQLR